MVNNEKQTLSLRIKVKNSKHPVDAYGFQGCRDKIGS